MPMVHPDVVLKAWVPGPLLVPQEGDVHGSSALLQLCLGQPVHVQVRVGHVHQQSDLCLRRDIARVQVASVIEHPVAQNQVELLRGDACLLLDNQLDVAHILRLADIQAHPLP
eukprot:CAMPEP_0204578660 /NCGR_PEP_ID=MMETSP0661-20131031/43050_1 /ASSEMBLY_ACC=CAM_ASM_000606 /TAXON_ID=109239 /ORGANISM="Alexandrium margalefi, Strain AMGDE01CS-322" /LENGTH=112 /DNA_ID=CAMNT_0051587605 /DNA_START=256 /DNA_END=594 /DNA_ORIENTATION=+